MVIKLKSRSKDPLRTAADLFRDSFCFPVHYIYPYIPRTETSPELTVVSVPSS